MTQYIHILSIIHFSKENSPLKIVKKNRETDLAIYVLEIKKNNGNPRFF